MKSNWRNNKDTNTQHEPLCTGNNVENVEMSVTEAVNTVAISDIATGS